MFCFVFNLRKHIDVWCNFSYEKSRFRFNLVGDVILCISVKCGFTFVFGLYSPAGHVAHAMAEDGVSLFLALSVCSRWPQRFAFCVRQMAA